MTWVARIFRDFPAFIHENEVVFGQIHHRHQSRVIDNFRWATSVNGN